jgi:hypothetical protein
MQSDDAPDIVGTHLGRPIFKNMQKDGVNYVFDRIAECDDDGWYHLTQLRPHEVLLKTGLIYHRQTEAA